MTAVLSLALFSSVAVAQLNPFPGSVALASGYNVLVGNPRGAAADPGWRSQPAFDVNCATCFAGGSKFETWDLPAGVSVTEAALCSYNSSQSVLSDGASTQTSQSSLVSSDEDFDVVLGEFLFSASSLLQEVSIASANADAALVLASAQCDVYNVALDAAHYSFHLTPNFEEGLASLPPLSLAAPVLAAYTAFVNTFGTHIPSALTLGGYAAQLTSFVGSNFSAIQSTTSSVEAAASASLLFFFGAAIDAGGSTAWSDYVAFAAAASDNATLCRPACPPSSPTVAVDPGQWRPTLSFSGAPGMMPPVPVSVTLVPLSQLLLQHALPAARAAGRIKGDHALRLEAAASNLEVFLNTSFCGLTPGCSSPTATPRLVPAPLPSLAQGRGVAGAAAGVLALSSSSDGLLLVAGGDASCGALPVPSTDVWLADLSAPGDGWVRKDPMPANGTAFSSAIVVSPPAQSPQLVVAGGFAPAAGGPVTPTTRTWWVDVTSSTWTPGPALTSARAGAAIAQFGGVLMLLGGWGDTGKALNTSECLPLSPTGGTTPCPGGQASTLLPGGVPLVGAAALVIPSPFTPGGETLVLAGGCAQANGNTPPFGSAAPCAQASAAVSFFELTGPQAGAWITAAPLPAGRVGLALVFEAPTPTTPLGALWALGGTPDAAAAGGGVGGEPSGSVFRLPLNVGSWLSIAAPDAWPAAWGAVAGPTPSGTLRVGGCASAGGGALQASPRISRFGVGAA